MFNATVTQIKDYFGMSTPQFMKEWKALSKEEQAFFRAEVGKVL